MQITSYLFLISVSLLAFIYYLIPYKFRWIPLLIASLGFYFTWAEGFVLVLIATILICYVGGIWLEKNRKDKSKAKRISTFLIILCLSPLLYFKYYLGFLEIKLNFEYFTKTIGMSFYSLQAISYLVDIKRGFVKPIKHLGYLSLYLSFFTNILAGPLERVKNLVPQFQEEKIYQKTNIISGLSLILWGWFKKLVIAENLLLIIQNNTSQGANLFVFILSSIFFSLQIYFDYSAYTDIGMGTAKLFGIDLTEGFRRTSLQTSRTNSWLSWNITIGAWFRDYVFSPLASKTKNPIVIQFIRLFTYILSGLWHGASLGFVIWGALNWAFTSLESKFRKNPQQSFFHTDSQNVFIRFLYWFSSAISNLLFSAFVNIWFRVSAFSSIILLITNIHFDNFKITKGFQFIYSMILFIGFELFVHLLMKEKRFDEWMLSISSNKRLLTVFVLIELIFIFGITTSSDFYYFRF
jgi:D-alanyl-lipoteichoic acid acyltransferase DltB (MBOAT superfamily)